MQGHNRTDSNRDLLTDAALLSLDNCLNISAYANRITDDQITKRRRPKKGIKLFLFSWILQILQSNKGLFVQLERLSVWIYEVSTFREMKSNPTRFLSPYLDCKQPLESATNESGQGNFSVNVLPLVFKGNKLTL